MGETYIFDPKSPVGWTRDDRAHWRYAAGLAERIARAVSPELDGHGFAVMIDGDHLPERLRLSTVGGGVRGYVHHLLQFEVGADFPGGFATVVYPPRARDDAGWLGTVFHELAHWISLPRPAPVPLDVFQQVAREVREARSGVEAQPRSITPEENRHWHNARFFRTLTHLTWRARGEGYHVSIGGTAYGLPSDRWFLDVLGDELRALEGKPFADVLASPMPTGFEAAFEATDDAANGTEV